MIKTAEIDYKDGETVCRGFLAYDNKNADHLPCVMVAHDWGGRGKASCEIAQKLATAGFAGFAIDMYGDAKQAHSKEEKRALMTPFREDRQLLANRIGAAFEAVQHLPMVNLKKIAAIGYCFGGLCVLDLARSGVDIKGVVSFHGLLAAPENCVFTPLTAKVLILHGYDDPLVLPAEIWQFADEMTNRQVDWQIHMYGLTAHSFTDPTANDNQMGLHYNAQADQRSWQSMMRFLNYIFV